MIINHVNIFESGLNLNRFKVETHKKEREQVDRVVVRMLVVQ